MGAGFLLAVVLVLIIVLILILVVILAAVLVLILVVVLIAVLVIHNRSSDNLYLRHCRFHSVTSISAFILRLKNQAGEEACGDRNCDASGTGLQTAGKNSEETVLLHGFFDTLGKIIAKSR